ncbi:MAG: SCP2 sterol-binding domain-containing protein [Silvanigrellaceae bacterium]|nr:SCP2 sterol-binding domain-containing protein [Silvanigrellaceae bacterium]
MEILNKLIYAQPQNLEAKYLLADVFEQIGYQKESTSLRNSFLAGALELRSGIPAGNVVKSLGSDLVSAMPTNLWLDYLAIRLNSEYAEGHHFIINLETPDNSEKYVIELSNASLTNIKGFQSEKANLSIKVNRTDLEDIIMGKSSFEEKINQGKITLVGDMNILKQLKGMIDNFSLDFEILPGTKVISSNFLR